MLWPQMAHIAVFVTLLWPQPAHSRPSACDTYEAIVANLRKVYGEYLEAKGKRKRGSRIEIYVSKKKTWTVVVVYKDGTACRWFAGTNWRKQQAQR